MKELKELLKQENLIIMACHEYLGFPEEIQFWGGMGVVTKAVSERLVHRGYEILVLPRRVKEYAAQGILYFEKNGVHILSLPIAPYEAGSQNSDLYNVYPVKEGITSLDHCYTSWRYLERHGIKNPIIHLHDWLSVGIGREAKRAGFRSVFTVHMSSERNSDNIKVDKRLELERLIGNYSDRIHYVSLAQRNSCKIHKWNHNKKHVIIPNGCDIYKYTPPEETPLEDYVLFVGRLSPVKNVGPLVKGWSIFNKEYPEVKLKILGASGISNVNVQMVINALNATQKNKVELRIEMVSEQERIKYYQNSAICCFPSSKEAFGVVALEAQSCFPKETEVYSNSEILRSYESEYDGLLLRIETTGHCIEVTPNHLFLTKNGWKKAKDLYVGTRLLTMGKTFDQMDRRTIANLAEKLSKNEHKKINIINWKEQCRYKKKSRTIGTPKALQGYIQTIQSEFDLRKDLLSSRFDRWRRYIKFPISKETQECITLFGDCQHISSNDRMVKIIRDVDQYRKEKNIKRSKISKNNISWIKNFAFIKNRLSLFNSQKRTMPSLNRIYRVAIGTNVPIIIYGEGKKNHKEGPQFKSETITKIQTKRFKGKVYNLGTLSNIYFANSFIVHNCGKPVVVGDVGGFKENVLEGVTGVHVKGNDPKSIAEGLITAYENKEVWGKNARSLVKNFYNWDKIVEQYVEDLYE